MDYKKFFEDYDPKEVDTLLELLSTSKADFAGHTPLTALEYTPLFEWLYYLGADEGRYTDYHYAGVRFEATTDIEYSGSGEYSSQESTTTTYVHCYHGQRYLGEIYISMGSTLGGDSELLAFEIIPNAEEEKLDKQTGQEENGVARLSKRVNDTSGVGSAQTKDIFITKENNMTVKTLNVTLVDNNSNLKGAGKIVFQKLGFITEHSDEEAKMDIIATGKVMEALTEHNYKREKTIDKDILRNTGRDVMLEPIELLSDPQLQWQIIRVA